MTHVYWMNMQHAWVMCPALLRHKRCRGTCGNLLYSMVTAYSRMHVYIALVFIQVICSVIINSLINTFNVFCCTKWAGVTTTYILCF